MTFSDTAVPVLVAWLVVIASVAASFALDAYGHSNISWGLDVVAVAAYLAVRRLRRSAAATLPSGHPKPDDS